MPDSPFDTDAPTVGLYHFDDLPEAEGPCTGVVPDASGAIGGPSNGECSFGGSAPAGPRYSLDTPFPDLPGLPALAAQGLVARLKF